MTKAKEIKQFLEKENISYKIINHEKISTVEAQAKALGVEKKKIAKSILLKTGEGQIILLVLPGSMSVNLNKMEKKLGISVKPASAKEILKIAGCDSGAVYPFGDLMGIKTYLDPAVLTSGKMYFSPGSHTESVMIETDDYMEAVRPLMLEGIVHKKGKKSTLGLSVPRSKTSAWYSQVIIKSGLADYTAVSGCIVFRPYAYEMWEKIQDFFNKKIKKSGVKNAYFPLFIPENLLKKEAEHVEGFSPEVAWVTHAGASRLNERLAVRPTSETIMYDSYKKWIRSYKDLPLRLNQWNSVVRWEFRHAVPFLRTREFLWQEGHTAFATKKEADAEVLEILNYYVEIYQDMMAISVIMGRKSNKEKFAGADYTTTVEVWLPHGKAIQGATSHALGQNFSKAFGITFMDQDKKQKNVWQNSWAITTRSIGVIVMAHGDDKGLVLPPKIAPIQVVMVPILYELTKEKVLSKCRELSIVLQKDFSVYLDDRDDYTPGWKYNAWELKGVPLRIELGPRDLEKEQAVMVRRDTGEKKVVLLKNLKASVGSMLKAIQENLYAKSRKHLEESKILVEDIDALARAVDEKKLILAAFCGKAACEDSIKERTGAKSLCFPFDQPEALKKRCVVCGHHAEEAAYFQKSY